MKRSVVLLAAALLALAGLGAGPPEDREGLVHLLRRAAVAPGPADLEELRGLGPREWLARQLNPPAEEPEVEALLAGLRLQGRDPAGVREAYLAGPSPARSLLDDLVRRRLLRALRSRWPLREAMASFWFNHFCADQRKSEVIAWNLPGLEDRVLRREALGRFRDLLGAAAANPAVLENLDLAVSSSPAVNENFGRELMELYTVGQRSGYTQEDVVEVARAFSGWTWEPGTWAFLYRPEWHEPGPRTVLGTAVEPGQREQGERVLDLLAAHPSTARFLARKLAVRFVDDHPPEALVERAAAVYLETDGHLGRVVECLLTSEEFQAHRLTKLKDPVEFVASAVRASGAEEALVADLAAGGGEVLLEAVYALGCPYLPPDARGFPDRASTWLSTADRRDRARLARRLAVEGGDVVGEVFLGSVSEETLAAVRRDPSPRAAALASPEFMRR